MRSIIATFVLASAMVLHAVAAPLAWDYRTTGSIAHINTNIHTPGRHITASPSSIASIASDLSLQKRSSIEAGLKHWVVELVKKSSANSKRFTSDLSPFKRFASDLSPFKRFVPDLSPFKRYVSDLSPFKRHASDLSPFRRTASDVASAKRDLSPF